MKTIVKLVTGQVGKLVENKTNIIRIRIILEEQRTSCLAQEQLNFLVTRL